MISTVKITGKFPLINGSTAQIDLNRNKKSKRVTTYIKDQNFKIERDSLDENMYRLFLSWPVTTRRAGMPGKRTLIKSFYLNPAQSGDYHFSFEKDISWEELNQDVPGNDQAHRYPRIIVSSGSEDCRLYEQFDSVANQVTARKQAIQDSLFKSSLSSHKTLYDFQSEALIILRQNHKEFDIKKRALIHKNLTNPVSTIQLYMTGNDDYAANFADYKYLTLHLSGRAKESAYYQRAMYRLQEMETK